jgi:hypothetical protein
MGLYRGRLLSPPPGGFSVSTTEYARVSWLCDHLGLGESELVAWLVRYALQNIQSNHLTALQEMAIYRDAGDEDSYPPSDDVPF